MHAFVVVPDWLPFAGGAVVVLAMLLAISAARARKRSEAISRVALEMGFSFEGDKWSDPGRSQDLTTGLFRKGSARTFRNIMTGNSGGLPASIFDYSFVTSDGKTSHTTAQTVATFSKTRLALPEFELAAAGILQKIGDAITHKNIQFDSHPDFSKRYQLRSPDGDRTRELFTPGLLSHLEGLDPQKKWRLEGMGQTLIVYRSGKRVDPTELRPFLDEAGALATSFFTLAGIAKPAG
jgi:hypothetical protein